MKKLVLVAVLGLALAACRDKAAGSDVEAKAEKKAAEIVGGAAAPAPAAEADAAMGAEHEEAAAGEAAKDAGPEGGPEEAEPVGDH